MPWRSHIVLIKAQAAKSDIHGCACAGPVAAAPASAPPAGAPSPTINSFPALDLQSPVLDSSPLPTPYPVEAQADPPTTDLATPPAVTDTIPSFPAPAPVPSAPASAAQRPPEPATSAESALHAVITLVGQQLVPFNQKRQVTGGGLHPGPATAAMPLHCHRQSRVKALNWLRSCDLDFLTNKRSTPGGVAR